MYDEENNNDDLIIPGDDEILDPDLAGEEPFEFGDSEDEDFEQDPEKDR